MSVNSSRNFAWDVRISMIRQLQGKLETRNYKADQPVRKTWRGSGELGISKFCIVRHVRELDIIIRILPYVQQKYYNDFDSQNKY